MKTMKKIVAILAVALLLCSMLPLSVMAADVYELVTDASTLKVDDKIIIVAKNANAALGTTQNTNNRAKADITKVENTISNISASVQVLTLKAGKTDGTFALYPGSGYLYAASSSKNYLKTETTLSANSSWTIEIADTGVATIKSAGTNTRNWMRYNSSNNPPIFSCYSSGQTDIAIYKLQASCEHNYVAEQTKAPTCTTAGENTHTCSNCNDSYTEKVNALGHNYVDGNCSTCGAKEPNTTTYTITFDADKTQRESFSTTKQVWKNGPLTFTNNKGNSTTAVADYTNPVRLYAKSQVVIECPGMIKIDFVCNSSSYATALTNSLAADANAVTNGNTVTVTLDVAGDTYTIEQLSAQVQLKSITVTAEVQDAEACEHKDAKECDAYCPDCGELISEGATHKSDAEFPCYEGKCEYCDEVIAAVDHVLDENDVCTVCGLAPTPEKPVDPENPQKYVFSEFAAGTQYAVNEKHFLDNAVTVITSQAHFTEELRIYSSSTNNGTVIIKSKKDISAIVLNAGNKVDVLNLYVSEDGEVYEAISVTSTSYKEYTVLIPEMTKYIKLDVAGTQQVRIKDMTLYFDGETPSVCTDHIYTGDYDATCNNCGETTRTVSFPEADSELTIAQINAIANGMDDKAKTDSKYYVIGKITEINNDEYGNMYITTDGTDSLYIYGTYDATGDIRFDAMAEKPVVGNTVKLYGKIGPYDGTAQMQYAWIIEVTCNHEYENACSKNCKLCGEETRPEAEHTYFDDCSAICEVCGYEREVSHNVIHAEAKAATCAANGNIEHWYCDKCGAAWLNAECNLNTNLRAVITPATGEHTYDDEYDADCNVCGDVREVPEKPVETIVYGDANGDGQVTILDAALLSQKLTGWAVELNEAGADANGDGQVTILDAALLSQKLTGWDVTLGPAQEHNDVVLGGWQGASV